MFRKILLFGFLFCFFSKLLLAQVGDTRSQELIDYTKPVKYEIGGVTISGIKYLDKICVNIFIRFDCWKNNYSSWNGD